MMMQMMYIHGLGYPVDGICMFRQCTGSYIINLKLSDIVNVLEVNQLFEDWVKKVILCPMLLNELYASYA